MGVIWADLDAFQAQLAFLGEVLDLLLSTLGCGTNGS